MNHTYFSVMAPFFRLRNAEDTSMHDEDPRLETAKFRAKRDQVVFAQLFLVNNSVVPFSYCLLSVCVNGYLAQNRWSSVK